VYFCEKTINRLCSLIVVDLVDNLALMCVYAQYVVDKSVDSVEIAADDGLDMGAQSD